MERALYLFVYLDYLTPIKIIKINMRVLDIGCRYQGNNIYL